MQTLLRTLITVTAMAIVRVSSTAQNYYDLVGEADIAISRGDWSDAAQYLSEAMELDPTNPHNPLLLSNIGIIRYTIGQDSLAIEALNEAHRRAPMAVTVLNNRARVFGAMGLDSLAYDDYSRIIELDTTLLEPLYHHAMLALRLGHIDRARTDCRLLDERHPDESSTLLARASMLTATEQWAEAARAYTPLIERDPSAELYCARAVCYLMEQRLSEASADISSGLKLNPDDRQLYLYRAYLNKMRMMNDDARADMIRALRGGQEPL